MKGEEERGRERGGTSFQGDGRGKGQVDQVFMGTAGGNGTSFHGDSRGKGQVVGTAGGRDKWHKWGTAKGEGCCNMFLYK